MYTFSFIVGNIIPKIVKCIHSATKTRDDAAWELGGGFGSEGRWFRRPVSAQRESVRDAGSQFQAMWAVLVRFLPETDKGMKPKLTMS